MARTSTKAVADLDSAVRAWGEAAQDVSRKASASVKRLVADVEAEVQVRRRRIAALEAAIASARGEARGRLARELHGATTALECARRGQREAKDAERRMQVLQRRVNEATATRVPGASTSLRRKLRALSDYESVPVPSASHGAAAGNASRAQTYARLAKMIGLAMVTEGADALAQTGEQATGRMPGRLQDPASVGLAAFHELRSGWDVYSHTPEMLALRARSLLGHK